VAGEIAAALQAEKMILLTDVEGVLDQQKRLINTMSDQDARRMIEAGVVEGGMFPKVKCCIKALRGGVRKAHIVDGRLKHAVLLEMFTDSGIGTEIVLT
jgi:acetylglutamate kinase